MLVQMLQRWLTQKAYTGGATLSYNRQVDNNPHQFGPGGAEFAKARYRELLDQGGDAYNSAQKATFEAMERFPPQQ